MRPQEDWTRAEVAKREYQSLFASNIALSYRNSPQNQAPNHLSDRAGALTQAEPQASGYPYSVPPPAPAVAQKPAAQAQDAAPQPIAAKDRSQERDAEIDRSDGKLYRLFEGTVLESVLTNRLDGAFSGPVNCMLTTNVYSHNGQRLLIPQGTRVLGEVRKVETFGQERLAVVFHRLIMPDGYSVTLDQFHGLNQIGETGLRDQVNHHYAQLFGVSLAIGAIAGLAERNTRYGLEVSASDAYRQGVAGSLSQSSLHILDRYLNVLPTFTIREGHRVKVILSDDLMLPAYENHSMPEDL